ncbi:hypothetical protein FrCorBMG51_02805 [Protofrankia coriariae]|uniref:Uncharacterized protein n=1 Tax=Protofrankia coriariae TaxID=1562887 RepID=A0ABR5F7F4_9ACTN|nr:hypothetical protein FrCorBMG51_02805 [Protofrankia coriariae]
MTVGPGETGGGEESVGLFDRGRDRQDGPGVVVRADDQARLEGTQAVEGEIRIGVGHALGRLDDGEGDAGRADRVPVDLCASGMLP